MSDSPSENVQINGAIVGPLVSGVSQIHHRVGICSSKGGWGNQYQENKKVNFSRNPHHRPESHANKLLSRYLRRPREKKSGLAWRRTVVYADLAWFGGFKRACIWLQQREGMAAPGAASLEHVKTGPTLNSMFNKVRDLICCT